MTSRNRKQDRPIKLVTLKVALKADKKTLDAIKEAFPSAKVSNGRCEIRIETEQPAEAAEKVRMLLEKIRSVV